MQLTVADIMASPVVTLPPEASLKDAHALTREKGIRHLPVVDAQQRLVAIVTQKVLISRVIRTLQLYGQEALEEQEAKTNIMDVAVKDYEWVTSSEKLTEIAPFFLQNKHGCLPVVDNNNTLVGIVTSSDFVKLSLRLLTEQSASAHS